MKKECYTDWNGDNREEIREGGPFARVCCSKAGLVRSHGSAPREGWYGSVFIGIRITFSGLDLG